MFATLDLSYGASPQDGDGGAPNNRPKRNQVRRACDWCKLMRIKCDNHRPCSNCHHARRECGMSGENQFRSIAAAVKEIETLRAQVRQYESTMKQLREAKSSSNSSNSANNNTNNSSGSGSSTASLSTSYADQPSASSRDGIRVDSILYDIASLPFFLKNMGDFLQTTRHRAELDLDISTCVGAAQAPPTLPPDPLGTSYFRPAQEVHFLDLFWQTHYFSYPILHEAQFRKEYTALVADSIPGEPRKASPLVDIVLALCIQLGSFFLRPPSDSHTSGAKSLERSCPSLAGYQYYQRCQDAIDQTIESPSITAVQCYIFSIVYLYEAGLLNRAQVVVGKAIMMAMMLGLPNEPVPSDPEPQREVARRTWWSLYILDAKLSMEVGRPPIIGPSHSTCHLPSDSPDVARWLAPHYPYDAACPTWLGFQTQTLRLVDAVRSIQSALYAKYDAVVGQHGYKYFVANGNPREECARVLAEKMKELDAWTKQVPAGYFVPRKDGQPYSTDRSPLELNPGPNVLIHCQRQRLLLELQYHQYCMSLYRPFISFASSSEVPTPLSDSQAAAALSHAMALTSMIHQAVTSSEALSGIYHVFRWQKNALFIMLGYAYTFPVNHSMAAIRKTIDMAVVVIDMYRDTLPEASRVAATARVLALDAGAMVGGFYPTGSTWSSSSTSSTPPPPPPPPSLSSLSSLRGSATTAASAAVSDEAPLPEKADLAMRASTVALPAVADEVLDLDILQELGDAGPYSWDAMDFPWPSPETASAAADAWASIGDVVVEAGRGAC
ncbi:fungal-specific transcription factor domain-containing protein [Hypoxylon fuscum]|nr:fungal-specific transcription factor domain-containing protein [Hypoxylon fuscum]